MYLAVAPRAPGGGAGLTRLPARMLVQPAIGWTGAWLESVLRCAPASAQAVSESGLGGGTAYPGPETLAPEACSGGV